MFTMFGNLFKLQMSGASTNKSRPMSFGIKDYKNYAPRVHACVEPHSPSIPTVSAVDEITGAWLRLSQLSVLDHHTYTVTCQRFLVFVFRSPPGQLKPSNAASDTAAPPAAAVPVSRRNQFRKSPINSRRRFISACFSRTIKS